MKTEHLYATDVGAIEKAAALLKAGKLVVFPTDTVYGVGADAFSAPAIEALYRVKERPREKGIPVLLAEVSDVEKVAQNVPSLAISLMERFWPGPLTLIVPGRPELPSNLSPVKTVAVRIPDNDVARAVIRQAGGAVAASSANRSGEEPARDAEEALAALKNRIAAVLDDGPATYGVPSTIVDCTTASPRILRTGALSAATLSLNRT